LLIRKAIQETKKEMIDNILDYYYTYKINGFNDSKEGRDLKEVFCKLEKLKREFGVKK